MLLVQYYEDYGKGAYHLMDMKIPLPTKKHAATFVYKGYWYAVGGVEGNGSIPE